MTKEEFKSKFDVKWLISNAGNLALLGGALWFIVAPRVVDVVKAGAPEVVEECFDDRDKNPNTFRGSCADLVIRVANEQTEMRLKALEEGQSANTRKLNTVNRNQETLIYQVGEVNKALPELRGNINTIIRMLGATEDDNGRRQ